MLARDFAGSGELPLKPWTARLAKAQDTEYFIIEVDKQRLFGP